jgi:hypothetical protein
LCTETPIQKGQKLENKMLSTKNQLSFMKDFLKRILERFATFGAVPPHLLLLEQLEEDAYVALRPSRCILA